MATEDQVKQRTVSFIVLMVILLGGIAALGVLLLLLRRQITIAEVDVRGGWRVWLGFVRRLSV